LALAWSVRDFERHDFPFAAVDDADLADLLPNRACAIGETWEIVPLAASASSSPTIRQVLRWPSSSSTVTRMPNRTTSLSGSGTDSSADSRRAFQ
jgi:hypothetical protein